MLPARDLVVGWLMLVALSAGTVLVTATGFIGDYRILASTAVLLLAGLKTRIILARFLGLKYSRFWMHTFDGLIGLFLILAFAIYAFTATG